MLDQLSNKISISGNHVDIDLPLIGYDEKGTSLLAFSPKSHKLSVIMRKTSDKCKPRDNLQNIWPQPLKTMKVMENKESQRNTMRSLKRHGNYSSGNKSEKTHFAHL